MKKAVLLFLVVLGTAVTCSQAIANDQSRYPLPIHSLSGNISTLEEMLKKGPVYLKFWASWCQPCLKQMDHFQQTHMKYQDRATVLGVNIWVNESKADIQNIVKDKGLSLPIAIDYDGKLAQAFNFIGTPYHLLIEQNGRIVHAGYEADKELDEKLALLVTGKLSDANAVDLGRAEPGSLDEKVARLVSSEETAAIFFASTWCDWYLEESRPDQSENCVQMQQWVNESAKTHEGVAWQLVASRLWTGEKELESYIAKYQIDMTAGLDTGNTVFARYGVKDFPTLVLFKNGKVVDRITTANSLADLNNRIHAAL